MISIILDQIANVKDIFQQIKPGSGDEGESAGGGIHPFLAEG